MLLLYLTLATLFASLAAALPTNVESHDQTSYEYAPGQLSNNSVASGTSFNFTDISTPQPVRGPYGAPSLIKENDDLNRQNPDAYAPPATDGGTVYQGACTSTGSSRYFV